MASWNLAGWHVHKQLGFTALLVAATSAALALPARADLIFSNLGPGQTYASVAPYSLGQAVAPGVDVAVAAAFAVPLGSGFDLTDIEIALEVSPFTPGPPADVTVRLLEDSAGLPGAVVPLAEWSLTELWRATTHGNIGPQQTISGISGIVLEGGAQYWLAAFVDDPLAIIWWWDNQTDHRDGNAVSGNRGATWRLDDCLGGCRTSAFAVYGSPVVVTTVPEPGTFYLLLAGALGLLGWRVTTKKNPHSA